MAQHGTQAFNCSRCKGVVIDGTCSDCGSVILMTVEQLKKQLRLHRKAGNKQVIKEISDELFTSPKPIVIEKIVKEYVKTGTVIEKIVEVPTIVEVPGPIQYRDRVVTKVVERVVEKVVKSKPIVVEKIVEVERVVDRLIEVQNTQEQRWQRSDKSVGPRGKPPTMTREMLLEARSMILTGSSAKDTAQHLGINLSLLSAYINKIGVLTDAGVNKLKGESRVREAGISGRLMDRLGARELWDAQRMFAMGISQKRVAESLGVRPQELCIFIKKDGTLTESGEARINASSFKLSFR